MSLRPFYNTLILLLLSFLIYSYFTKIILFLVINRVFTLDVLPLIKKKWQENALMALVLQLMGNELGKYTGRNSFINNNCPINGQNLFDKYDKKNMARKSFNNDSCKINGK
ncbi:hypothetical protein RhiirA4_489922 [Rhizophagus irregularis]|uniref:Uncharacterized protein n=1 Tax=Rhizophagus irregularis TaxID=588596 RepID=A0A2I1HVB1_9GLOM|nr:hypothetical protein RhiirA4_468565 [Rhizophagus irregularis]PKY62475.1 hypothetical protein RhiirA4_488992 [Rhizophagus irregularis]PKY62793.1 hypothetical protein RhiirA4_489922 [Rhizophagus irregularis]